MTSWDDSMTAVDVRCLQLDLTLPHIPLKFPFFFFFLSFFLWQLWQEIVAALPDLDPQNTKNSEKPTAPTWEHADKCYICNGVFTWVWGREINKQFNK